MDLLTPPPAPPLTDVANDVRRLEFLLRETHHRVKNNLQIISSLLSLQARYVTDPAAGQFLRASEGRVHAIAFIHDNLYRSGDLSHVDFCDYATSLVQHLFRTYGATQRGLGHEVSVTRARLTVDRAIPCALLLNELVTNSIRHAFPGDRRGMVRIAMQEVGPARLELVVQDDGVGLPPGLDPRHSDSFGLDLVFTFAEQLDADVAVQGSPGTTFRLSFGSLARGGRQSCE